MGSFRPIQTPQRLHFYQLLRDARVAAALDAERLDAPVQAVEQLGKFLNHHRGTGLGDYGSAVRAFIEEAPVPAEVLCSFDYLYDLVRQARNTMAHEGNYVRNAVQHAIELVLILEEVISRKLFKVRHRMVAPVVQIGLWQTVGDARQLMLRNSFSFLPVETEAGWRVVLDCEVVRYLRTPAAGPPTGGHVPALKDPISTAIQHGLQLVLPVFAGPEDLVDEVPIRHSVPALVMDLPERPDRLLGIVTPFDLL